MQHALVEYDRAKLAPLVASSHSISDVIRALGLEPNGGNHRMISALVRRYGLDTTHFRHGALVGRVREIPADTLARLVEQSTSIAQVLAALALPTKGRAHHELTNVLEHLASTRLATRRRTPIPTGSARTHRAPRKRAAVLYGRSNASVVE